MPNFSDTQISKWANEYERELCAVNNLIVDRISLAITQGESDYTLPNYLTSIRAVLWQGKMVYPKSFGKSMATNDTPLTATESIPLEYIFSSLGAAVIKFLPFPSITIAEYVGDLFTPVADEAAVIIEFYRTPHLTDTDVRIPTWARRYLLKDYICMKAFRVDSTTQDLKASRYYEARMAENVNYVKTINQSLRGSYLNVLSEHPQRGRTRPGRPILPDNFAR